MHPPSYLAPLLMALAAAPIQPIQAQQEPLLLRGATVVDGTGAAPRPRTSVLIEGNRITRVAPDSEIAPPPGARVIDLSGHWLTPGLWDLHVHLGKVGPAALPLFVAAGITAVRDMGGQIDTLLAWRREIAAGTRLGPRIVLAGPMLEAPATLERIAQKPTTEPWRRTRIAVPNPTAAAAIVDSVSALGVDFIKIRETPDLETYRAIVQAAHARGIAIAGHAPFGMPVEQGARLGLATFEHASYPYPLDTTPAVRARLLTAFREGGTAIVPTMVAWSTRLMHPDSIRAFIADSGGRRDPRRVLVPRPVIEEWGYELADMKPKSPESLTGWCGFINRTLQDLAAMHDAGIPVLAGTDVSQLGLLPGWSLHEELDILVRGGVMSPAEALRAATSVAARAAGMQDVGTIAPGQRADLLVLTADPTRDVAALRQLRAVVLDGVLREGEKLARPAGIELLPGVREAGCGVLAR